METQEFIALREDHNRHITVPYVAITTIVLDSKSSP